MQDPTEIEELKASLQTLKGRIENVHSKLTQEHHSTTKKATSAHTASVRAPEIPEAPQYSFALLANELRADVAAVRDSLAWLMKSIDRNYAKHQRH